MSWMRVWIRPWLRGGVRRRVVGLSWMVWVGAVCPGLVLAEDVERDEAVSFGWRTVIEREEIERRQWRTLVDVLKAQPGVHVSQLGGPGQDALLFFRGNTPGGVLLRVDGIDVSNPAAMPSPFVVDPGGRSAGQIVPDLLTENIERIEIRRGPQSATAGSDAIGGVIDVETRRGAGDASPWASFEAGGFGTTRQSAGISGSADRVAYSFAYANARTRGIAGTPSDFGGHERDANRNDTLSGRLDVTLSEALALELSGRWIDEETQLDPLLLAPIGIEFNPPGIIGRGLDRRADRGERRRLFLGAGAELSLLDERWIQRLDVRVGDHEVRERS